MIMTQNKTQKAAIRRRMAETGEPYVIARRIILDETGPTVPGPAAGAIAPAGALTPEELYAREAAAAGASATAIDAQTLVYRLEAAAERAQEAAERARDLADRAEEEAERTEDLAGQAEEAAEEAEEWAEPAEKRLLRERAARLQEAWEQAQLRAEQAEEVAVAAEERAELAADAAEEAANGEFTRPADDDPRSVWAAATGDGFGQADRAGMWAGNGFARPGGVRTWARANEADTGPEDEGLVPPVPPVPPSPPRPPAPPAFRW
jgi:hypothetical protein